MTKVLVLGAGGRIGRWAIDMLAKRKDVALTLVLRDASKLHGPAAVNAHVIEGDVLDSKLLDHAMAGQDVVYANLAGDVDVQAVNIVRSMKSSRVERLIFITSLGIYDEVPGKFGKWNQKEIGQYLGPYRKAADLIEASGLSYAILHAKRRRCCDPGVTPWMFYSSSSVLSNRISKDFGAGDQT